MKDYIIGAAIALLIVFIVLFVFKKMKKNGTIKKDILKVIDLDGRGKITSEMVDGDWNLHKTRVRIAPPLDKYKNNYKEKRTEFYNSLDKKTFDTYSSMNVEDRINGLDLI